MLRDYFLNGAGELIPQVRVPSWGSPDWVRGSARWWDTRSSPVGWDIVGLWGRGPPPPPTTQAWHCKQPPTLSLLIRVIFMAALAVRPLK